jgi:hypothetical protein
VLHKGGARSREWFVDKTILSGDHWSTQEAHYCKVLVIIVLLLGTLCSWE